MGGLWDGNVDVVAVVEEEGNVWEIGFAASAEGVCVCVQNGERGRDSLCSCEVYFKVGGYVVADEGLGRLGVVRGWFRIRK
jgi:hypothetical protein